ncbi:hypothetical protein KY386_00255 [Candidatus Parcubacteria bacterium]|nr:hypothetical protein [Candidatus Parcubacteria bacterium]
MPSAQLFDIARLRGEPKIVVVGSYGSIIQSMLDFDHLAGRRSPSVVAIIGTGRKSERYFFGRTEIMIPVVPSPAALPPGALRQVNFFLNLSSGRRVLDSTRQLLAALPNLVGGVVFAEGVPERQALQLQRLTARKGVWMVGAASVGLVVPGSIKLGAIGGTQPRQLEEARLLEAGSVAVISSSGGMVNELIRLVAGSGRRLSWALALGGERFPLTAPREAFLAAQADPPTKAIAYFGELGGRDEYELAELLQQGAVTKPVVCYIAGTVAELFTTPPQFGHAKAMAAREDESARAKRAALAAAGAQVAETFNDIAVLLQRLPDGPGPAPPPGDNRAHLLESRRPALFASSISRDAGGAVQLLGQDLLGLAEQRSFAWIVASLLLGKPVRSAELERFVEFVLRLLVDHGPYVSGAVNTMVTARAGRDLVSSLAAGLLTIGPRFGGAINAAAAAWLEGVVAAKSPAHFVEEQAARRLYIAGIGHRKYRVDAPDPRVERLLRFADGLPQQRFTGFAIAVEQITAQKKGNLILNVDGAIAAVLLDLLSERESYSDEQLRSLVEQEFFNALFVLSRAVGLTAHYLDQRRLDEGLFRLPEDQVTRADVDLSEQ